MASSHPPPWLGGPAGPQAVTPASSGSAQLAPVESWPSPVISIQTSDNSTLQVDKQLLMSSSKFWTDILEACDTGHITVDESRHTLELLLQVLRNEVPASTFDTRDSSCWEQYKTVLVVADKYDMSLVHERCEKWLVSRCLRGKVRSPGYRFHDVHVGQEWLLLCAKYGLRHLGWFVAYDLGYQLQERGWGSQAVPDFLAGVTDPELLKTMLEAVADAVAQRLGPAPPGPAAAGGTAVQGAVQGAAAAGPLTLPQPLQPAAPGPGGP
ncbi:hypothetical protein V8C86DRAFT_2926005 [Haematococcus lacustris]